MASRSAKTGLSPSTTSGFKKNEAGGIDLGRKSQPSISNTGIGISQDMGNVGGLNVKGGVSIDVSPIDFGISGHPSFEDPSQSAVSISGGAEIPGGLLGVSGGLTINTSTGEVEEVSIGAEAGGIGVNLSASATGEIGVEFTYQIPFTPIEISIGFGTDPKPKEPTPSPSPTTSPPGTDNPDASKPPTVFPEPTFPIGDPSKSCAIYFGLQQLSWDNYFAYHVTKRVYQSSGSYDFETGMGTSSATGEYIVKEKPSGKIINHVDFTKSSTINVHYNSVDLRSSTYDYAVNVSYFNDTEGNAVHNRLVYGSERSIYNYARSVSGVETSAKHVKQNYLYILSSNCYSSPEPPTPSPTPSPSSPPFPNPPPRKRNMDECCRESIRLGRINRRFLQEVMIMLGRPLDSRGNLVAIPPKAKYFGEPIERVKTPIEDITNPEKETIVFNNYYQLLMYSLGQQINLDVAVDPKSFRAPAGKLQNPNYQRDSEESLATNVQPDEDKGGNKRELEIGEDIKINSLVQQQQYLFQAVRRLEYLFPAGELADARFDKDLIIPGATGQLQIHNLIHFKEFLVQFLNATLGNPKIPIKMEDINAIKEGKQEATFNHFSISHMIRELYKLVLESGDDINAIMETTIRDFRTNLANRIQIVQIAEMAQALVVDSGMLESQEFIPVKLDGDPYAGKWKPGQGFEPDEDLDSNDEKATEKLMRATLKNFEAQVKVIRRDKRENADVRDLLLQLAEMFIRSNAIPATPEGIEKALASARFREKVNGALTRSQVKRAAAAKLSRTKKRKK